MNVAIIGKNSYIGGRIRDALAANGVEATEVDALGDAWRSFDFSRCDAVVHVAAIVHRKDLTDFDAYRKANTDLPIEVATTAKRAGVRQFVFLSTMAVFGRGKSTSAWELDGTEPLASCTPYGRSKLEAERNLAEMEDGQFCVATVRPPSVYGKGCRGNLFDIYKRLASASYVVPIAAPDVKQGMIHIDNLCSCICEIVRTRRSGIFHPQDDEILSTGEILCCIRAAHGKRYTTSRLAGTLLSALKWTSAFRKLFGGIAYSQVLVRANGFACDMLTTREGIRRTFR